MPSSWAMSSLFSELVGVWVVKAVLPYLSCSHCLYVRQCIDADGRNQYLIRWHQALIGAEIRMIAAAVLKDIIIDRGRQRRRVGLVTALISMAAGTRETARPTP